MDYFTFELEGSRVGYLVEDDDGRTLYSRAVIRIGDNTTDNPFWIRYEDDLILAYRHGDGDWVEFDADPGTFPTAALPILARRLEAGESLHYRQLLEETGEVGGEAVLRRDGDKVIETVDGRPWRHVVFDGERVVEYGWGGEAVSRRVGSLEEALYGSSLD